MIKAYLMTREEFEILKHGDKIVANIGIGKVEAEVFTTNKRDDTIDFVMFENGLQRFRHCLYYNAEVVKDDKKS